MSSNLTASAKFDNRSMIVIYFEETAVKHILLSIISGPGDQGGDDALHALGGGFNSRAVHQNLWACGANWEHIGFARRSPGFESPQVHQD